jgi:hypothetical protein
VREREQEAKRRIAALAEKRKHPPGARARSVAAALFSDPWLADAIVQRLRDDLIVVEDGHERRLSPGEFMNVRIVDPEDIVVLYVVSLAIADGGLFRLHEPDRLGDISDVPASLGRIRRNGLIEAERDGNAWRVRWGKRALDVARKAGVGICSDGRGLP